MSEFAKTGSASADDIAEYKTWLAERPKFIQDLASEYPPDFVYYLDPPGQYVGMYSYSEDGTVTVIAPVEWNPWMPVAHQVFGIDPKNLRRVPTEEFAKVQP